jgi:hypothetical protein
MRRYETVYTVTEQDARDIAERRARDEGLYVASVDEVIDLGPDKHPTADPAARWWLVWLAVGS